jgi:hypothetical protein
MHQFRQSFKSARVTLMKNLPTPVSMMENLDSLKPPRIPPLLPMELIHFQSNCPCGSIVLKKAGE